MKQMAGITDICGYSGRDLSLLWLLRDFESKNELEKVDDEVQKLFASGNPAAELSSFYRLFADSSGH